MHGINPIFKFDDLILSRFCGGYKYIYIFIVIPRMRFMVT